MMWQNPELQNLMYDRQDYSGMVQSDREHWSEKP